MKGNPLTTLAMGAALVTIGLTGAAFWLSYEHLHDVADGNGLNGARAWAWPATVDLFIVAGELLMLRAALRGRVDPWAITLTASGSLGSIALNVAGVGTQARVLEYVVAAVPPVAALLAFGALMRQVHERLADHVAAPASIPPVPPVVVPPGARLLPIVARPEQHGPKTATPRPPRAPAKPKPPRKTAAGKTPRLPFAEQLVKAREATASWADEELKAEPIRQALGCGQDRSRLLRDALKTERSADNAVTDSRQSDVEAVAV